MKTNLRFTCGLTTILYSNNRQRQARRMRRDIKSYDNRGEETIDKLTNEESRIVSQLMLLTRL